MFLVLPAKRIFLCILGVCDMVTIYKIYCDGVLIHNPQVMTDTLVLGDVQLHIEDNAAGSLNFIMYPNHIRYGVIHLFKSKISVYANNEKIWEGRPINMSHNTDKSLSVTCEGRLAYLNDVHMLNHATETYTFGLEGGINYTLNRYNSIKPLADRIDDIEMKNYVDRPYDVVKFPPENYTTCFERLSALVDNLNGHITITFKDGKTVLTSFTEPETPEDAIATAKYGKNIVDYTIEHNIDDFGTVVIPLGKSQIVSGHSEDGPNDLFPLDVQSVNNGSIFIYNQADVDAYGWIEKTYRWETCDDPSKLKALGEKYLEYILSAYISISVTFISDVPLKLYDRVLIDLSPLYNLQFYGRIWSIDINISSPADTRYSITQQELVKLTNLI